MIKEGDNCVNFVVEVKNGTAAEFVRAVNHILAEMLGDPSLINEMVSIIEEGSHRINVAVLLPVLPDELKEQTSVVLPILKKLMEKTKVEQWFDISIRLATSLEQIFLEGGEPILNEVLRGIAIDFKLNVWENLADFLIQEVPQLQG